MLTAVGFDLNRKLARQYEHKVISPNHLAAKDLVDAIAGLLPNS